MRYAKTLALLAAGLMLAGCGQPAGTTNDGGKGDGEKKADSGKKPDGGKGGHAPHGAGKNGGVIFDLGTYHGELTVNHDTKKMNVYFYKEVKGKKEKDWPEEAVPFKELTVVTKESKTKDGKKVPPMTITLRPKDAKDGKAKEYEGEDAGLANVADYEGDIFGNIGEDRINGHFKEG